MLYQDADVQMRLRCLENGMNFLKSPYVAPFPVRVPRRSSILQLCPSVILHDSYALCLKNPALRPSRSLARHSHRVPPRADSDMRTHIATATGKRPDIGTCEAYRHSILAVVQWCFAAA